MLFHDAAPVDMPLELYRRLLQTAGRIVAEKDVRKLCHIILTEACAMTGADGGTFYLVNQDAGGMDAALRFMVVSNRSLGVDSADESWLAEHFPLLPLFHEVDGQRVANEHNIASYAYHHRTLVNIADAYTDKRFDFSGTRVFDEQRGYRSQSFIAVPLLGESGRVIGVFQLINAIDPRNGEVTPFPRVMEPVVQTLAGFAALALDHQIEAAQQRDLLLELAGEPNTRALIEKILQEAKLLTNADGGTLYLLKDDEPPRLEFALVLNDSLNLRMGGLHGSEVTLPPVPLYREDGSENLNTVVTCAALRREVINIADAYSDAQFDFSGTRAFDQRTGYRSQSFLAVPLLNHENDVVGVLQLLNARDPRTGAVVPFSPHVEALVSALAAYAAIALTNVMLVQDLKNLLDAFIRCIAQAIDAKSRHTSAHCQKVPVLMEMIARAACEDETLFADFFLNDDEWYELRVAAWLHDCGKLATPDSVLDKSTKLHLMRDGIEAIHARIAARKQQCIVDYYQSLNGDAAHDAVEKQRLEAALAQLDSDRQFLVAANKGGEFMAEASKARVQAIAAQTWLDADGVEQPLLTEEEVYNLCIERGTLTGEERKVINNHMSVTIDMLESLPFPKKLRRVPEYAGGHHEKMDGSGFPRGLTREQMSLPARMMAIADIFEALTARDRPYKPPMKISMSLDILRRMSQEGHIDPDLFRLFVRARVWEQYARDALLPEQLDIEDASAYLA